MVHLLYLNFVFCLFCLSFWVFFYQNNAEWASHLLVSGFIPSDD